MAFQTGKGRRVQIPAKGNAPDSHNPGPTPAPTEDALVKLTRAKDTAWGRQSYGANGYPGPASVEPGAKISSPLADQLKAKAAEGDAGDLLQTIIEKGTARDSMVDLASPQTRDVSKEQYPSAHGQVRRSLDSGSPGGTVPSVTGHSPMSDELRRRQAALQRASGQGE
jgi:hypothetical protein